MKKTLILIAVLVATVACNDEKNNKKVYLSESNGKINNVSIIIDDMLWSGEIGDTLRKKFASPVEGLPQEEPLFNLNQYPTKIFEGFVTKSRNIIVVNKGNQNGFTAKTDKYAKPQQFFYISGNTNADIIHIIENKAAEIIKTIKKAEIVENQKRLQKALISDAPLNEALGIQLNIGAGYKFEVTPSKDFFWIRKEFQTGYNSILAYQVPINQLENDSLVIKNIVAIRDSVGKVNIQGTLPNTWMITEKAYTPYLYEIEVANKKTYLTKGTWELKNDFMAGPFVNYAIKDEKNNRYIILEGFTYNPSKAKRDLVFELESIIQSVQFLQ